jgi:hypothetical protein
MQGLSGAVPKGVNEVGITPTGSMPPSTGEQILGGLTGVGGVLANAKTKTGESVLSNLLGI